MIFKTKTYSVLALSFVLIASVFVVGGSKRVDAASCVDPGTYGSVSMNVAIPVTGEYVVWARIQTTSPGDSALLIEVNGDTCYSVGNSSLPANTWNWVNYQGSNTNDIMKYTFGSVGNKTIKVIGQRADVKIDKVMFLGTAEQCSSNGTTPSGDGTNCDTGVAATSSSGGGSTSQAVTTPSIVSSNPESVEKVEYYVDGVLVQSAEGAQGFDTSLVENGDYTLTTKVQYKDGTTAEESALLSVNNPPQTLGALRRWAKRNRTALYSITGVVSIAGVAGMLLFGRKFLHHKKLYLMHHGLAK